MTFFLDDLSDLRNAGGWGCCTFCQFHRRHQKNILLQLSPDPTSTNWLFPSTNSKYLFSLPCWTVCLFCSWLLAPHSPFSFSERPTKPNCGAQQCGTIRQDMHARGVYESGICTRLEHSIHHCPRTKCVRGSTLPTKSSLLPLETDHTV